MNRPFSPPPTQDSRLNQPLYLVEVGFSEPWFHEPIRDMTRAGLVKDIATGQFERVVRVIEIGPPDGLSGLVGPWRDITKDVAREVRDHIAAEQDPISWDMKDWLHRHLGVMSTHGMVDA